MDALKRSHLEDLQQQMSAHKITLDSAKEEAARARLAELESERQRAQKELGLKLNNSATTTTFHAIFHGILRYFTRFLDGLNEKWEQRYASELDEQTQQHSQQMQVARMELERAIELSKQKVKT